MTPILNSEFLDEIRTLSSFDAGCDLDSLSKTVDTPAALIELLVRGSQVRKEEACRYLADKVGVAYVDPFSSVVTDEAREAIPAEIATKACVMPLYKLGDGLTAAMAHPEDTVLVARLSKIAKMPVSPVFALRGDILDAVQIQYCTEESIEESLASLENHALFNEDIDLDEGGEQIARQAESEQLVEFVESIIYFSLRRDASDIHIEPHETKVIVRYRIDGILREVLEYPRKIHKSVVTRLKILANQNIAESRFPSDGRFSLMLGTTKASFRFSSIPSQYGQKVVLRVLGNTGMKSIITLDRMMMSQTVLNPFRRMIKNPSGIIFVTGPTGSGKTTTLYSTLAELNDPSINISTIEDPIEMQLEGITQSQVDSHIDLSFALMLRSLLRQDPDVILIGEIRDKETAKIATEAALTGHIVLATLHTNSAPEAIIRLEDIGVDHYMIAPSVIGVLAQRLAARICENCKEPYKPAESVLRRFFDDEVLPDVTFYRGTGCRVCNQTGYKGRVAFHELFLVNQEVRAKISDHASQREVIAAATRVGYKPLRYDGLKKVLLGLTTIDEIESQTMTEFTS
ncbi:GspE/PulE family protein [Synoicihabitans lomoniglobus]|uniref:GspE/PulE family protein n=1 Tax=Synoicihabitans lomoniglobus TaxID=2909285 RepID=A0AAE9ZXD6_9BACT|nr:GspE/PulE family protein [Opitutaceae bacterium LMO-M01]WED64660.1 GspE/PulE family protein [Opitutaceae bacterium LMO-M01]